MTTDTIRLRSRMQQPLSRSAFYAALREIGTTTMQRELVEEALAWIEDSERDAEQRFSQLMARISSCTVLESMLREARGYIESDYTGSRGDLSGGLLGRIDNALSGTPQQPRKLTDAERTRIQSLIGERDWRSDGPLFDCIESLLAGWTAPWQPIATVPKEPGKEVLLRVKMRAGSRYGTLVGHYMPGGHCIEDHPPIDAGWYFWNGGMFDKAAEPTHWMPLPEGPQ